MGYDIFISYNATEVANEANVLKQLLIDKYSLTVFCSACDSTNDDQHSATNIAMNNTNNQKNFIDYCTIKTNLITSKLVIILGSPNYGVSFPRVVTSTLATISKSVSLTSLRPSVFYPSFNELLTINDIRPRYIYILQILPKSMDIAVYNNLIETNILNKLSTSPYYLSKNIWDIQRESNLQVPEAIINDIYNYRQKHENCWSISEYFNYYFEPQKLQITILDDLDDDTILDDTEDNDDLEIHFFVPKKEQITTKPTNYNVFNIFHTNADKIKPLRHTKQYSNLLYSYKNTNNRRITYNYLMLQEDIFYNKLTNKNYYQESIQEIISICKKIYKKKELSLLPILSISNNDTTTIMEVLHQLLITIQSYPNNIAFQLRSGQVIQKICYMGYLYCDCLGQIGFLQYYIKLLQLYPYYENIQYQGLRTIEILLINNTNNQARFMEYQGFICVLQTLQRFNKDTIMVQYCMFVINNILPKHTEYVIEFINHYYGMDYLFMIFQESLFSPNIPLFGFKIMECFFNHYLPIYREQQKLCINHSASTIDSSESISSYTGSVEDTSIMMNQSTPKGCWCTATCSSTTSSSTIFSSCFGHSSSSSTVVPITETIPYSLTYRIEHSYEIIMNIFHYYINDYYLFLDYPDVIGQCLLFFNRWSIDDLPYFQSIIEKNKIIQSLVTLLHKLLNQRAKNTRKNNPSTSYGKIDLLLYTLRILGRLCSTSNSLYRKLNQQHILDNHGLIFLHSIIKDTTVIMNTRWTSLSATNCITRPLPNNTMFELSNKLCIYTQDEKINAYYALKCLIYSNTDLLLVDQIHSIIQSLYTIIKQMIEKLRISDATITSESPSDDNATTIEEFVWLMEAFYVCYAKNNALQTYIQDELHIIKYSIEIFHQYRQFPIRILTGILRMVQELTNKHINNQRLFVQHQGIQILITILQFYSTNDKIIVPILTLLYTILEEYNPINQNLFIQQLQGYDLLYSLCINNNHQCTTNYWILIYTLVIIGACVHNNIPNKLLLGNQHSISFIIQIMEMDKEDNDINQDDDNNNNNTTKRKKQKQTSSIEKRKSNQLTRNGYTLLSRMIHQCPINLNYLIQPYYQRNINTLIQIMEDNIYNEDIQDYAIEFFNNIIQDYPFIGTFFNYSKFIDHVKNVSQIFCDNYNINRYRRHILRNLNNDNIDIPNDLPNNNNGSVEISRTIWYYL